MESKFKFGKIVTGEAFVNRIKEKERLSSNFENGVNTILISPRRWGKTSLVKVASREIMKRKKQVKFCFIDLFSIRSEQDFYNFYAKEVVKATSNKVEEWIAMGKRFLQHITPKFSFGIDPMNDFEISFDINSIEKDYKEILNLPEKIAKEKKIKVIVCIDEFQNLATFKEPLVFQKRVRSVWQHHERTYYCLYGSKRHMMMELFEDQSMPFYKFGDVFYMQKIEEFYLTRFIVKSFHRTRKFIHPELAKEIVEMMQCHPYYVQQLAHLVWVRTFKKTNEEIFYNALDDLLTQNSILYQKEVEELSNTQLNFLKALIDKVEALSSSETLAKYKLGTSANVVKIKEALEKKEIIDTVSNKIEFLDPAFELWIKKYLR